VIIIGFKTWDRIEGGVFWFLVGPYYFVTRKHLSLYPAMISDMNKPHLFVTARSKAQNYHVRTLRSWVGIPLEAWISAFALFLFFCVGSGLARADYPSKKTYRLFTRSVISNLIMNRPKSLIVEEEILHMYILGRRCYEYLIFLERVMRNFETQIFHISAML
jgi:hypothetical protein